MAKLTITVDEGTLKAARIRAAELGTTVNDLVRSYLESFAGTAAERRRATRELLDLSLATSGRRGRRQWTREELPDRVQERRASRELDG